jgi:hypothetical protein
VGPGDDQLDFWMQCRCMFTASVSEPCGLWREAVREREQE